MFLSVILLRKQFKTDADILCLYFQDQMSSTAHRISVPLVVRLQQVQVMPHLPLLHDRSTCCAAARSGSHAAPTLYCGPMSARKSSSSPNICGAAATSASNAVLPFTAGPMSGRMSSSYRSTCTVGQLQQVHVMLYLTLLQDPCL